MTLQNIWRRCTIRLCALPCHGLPRPRCHQRGLATGIDPCAATNQIITLPDIPELFHPNFLDILLPPSPSDADPGKDAVIVSPFINVLNSTIGTAGFPGWNKAYTSTGSSLLDAFLFVNPQIDRAQISQYLNTAWKEDPSLTLKIIWNLRSIHDGKGDPELFYRAFGWLYDNHPRTAISNLHLLVEPVCTSGRGVEGPHGNWGDLLNILSLATRHELHDANQSPLWMRDKKKKKVHELQRISGRRHAKQLVAFHDQLIQRLEDPKYRALYVAVARLFSERLVKDLELLDHLKALPPRADRLPSSEISLASEWAPTPGGSHDRVSNISTAIARLVVSSKSNVVPQLEALSYSLDPNHEALILRSVYHRWILTELRKFIQSPEALSSANRWSEIEYSTVPTAYMNSNSGKFLKHDRKRFCEYINAVESGNANIRGATLIPHNIVEKIYDTRKHCGRSKTIDPSMVEPMNAAKEIERRVAEVQWKALIEDLKAHGTLENSMAVFDSSYQMTSYRIAKEDVYRVFPAIALSLIVAHLNKQPLNVGFITFGEDPRYVPLDLARSVQENVGALPREHSYETNFTAVFTKLILPLALKNKLAQKDMIKRLFVFSSMDFEGSYDNDDEKENWTKRALKELVTSYDVVEKAYKEAGYDIPEIVFWDMGDDNGRVHVKWDQKGVAVMSGYSPAMLKVFMNDDGKEFTPINVMMRVLRMESFAGLEVVD